MLFLFFFAFSVEMSLSFLPSHFASPSQHTHSHSHPPPSKKLHKTHTVDYIRKNIGFEEDLNRRRTDLEKAFISSQRMCVCV